ncbi:hypothetical protein GmRootV59_55830 (plasmid) [Variovorax sp. V59]
MLAAHLAAVLAGVVGVRLDLLLENLGGVELEHLRGVVVGPGDCVKKRHGYALVEAMPDGLAGWKKERKEKPARTRPKPR